MNSNKSIYIKKLARFTKNIKLNDDTTSECEHTIQKRLVDTYIDNKLPTFENNTAISVQYNNTKRVRSYIKITKKYNNTDINTYSIFTYYILNTSHVLILTKYKIQNKSFIIYKTSNKLPKNIISDNIYTENLSHDTIVEQSHDDKILSNTETTNIINALSSSELNTHPSITIPLSNNLDPLLLELYYIIINNSYISKTPSDTLSRLVWIILNL